MVERVAGLVECHVFREHHRQVFVRHRHDIAFRAMDYRDRAAPIALARDTPVAQAEVHLPLANGHVAAHLALEPFGDILFGLLDSHAVEEA